MVKVVLNYELISQFSLEGKLKELYYYTKTVSITAGRGFCPKSELIKKLGVSKATAYKWIDKMIQANMIQLKEGMIYVKGKNAFTKERGIRSKLHIKFYNLESFKAFRNHFLIQGALILQNRFRYSHRHLMKNLKCPLLVERIQYPISSSRSRVGCSLSFISKKTGYSKTTASKALRGNSIPTWEFIKHSSITESNILTKLSIYKDFPRIKLFRGSLYYRSSNRITAQAEISRRRI